MDPLINALKFLIGLVFSFYSYLLVLRLWMQKYRANAFNPVAQFVRKLSDPVVKPVRRIVPGFKGFDLAIVFLIWLVQWAVFVLLFWLSSGSIPGWLGGALTAVGEVMSLMVGFFIVVVILAAVLSWLPQLQNSPVAGIIYLLATPLMARVRGRIPLVAGFDLSPIVIIVALKLLDIILINPLIAWGYGLALVGV